MSTFKKFLYGFVFFITLILVLIVYFQNIFYTITMYFFKSTTSATFVIAFISVVSFISGAFFVLFLQSLLTSDSKDIDDFDL